MTIKEVSAQYGLSQDTLRYYERAGMIPHVNRGMSGARDYTEQDLKWVALAKCMREAGLPVGAMAEYVRLSEQGDRTIPDRLALLVHQRGELLAQQRRIAETIDRLNYKISRYEAAVKTGVLVWEQEEGEGQE